MYVHLVEQVRKHVHPHPKMIFIKKAELIEAQVSPKEKGLSRGSQAPSRAGVQWGRGWVCLVALVLVPRSCLCRVKMPHSSLASEAPLQGAEGRRVDSTWLRWISCRPHAHGSRSQAPGGGRERRATAEMIHVEILETRGIFVPQLVERGAFRIGYNFPLSFSDGERVCTDLNNVLVVFSRVYRSGENRADTAQKGFELQVAA